MDAWASAAAAYPLWANPATTGPLGGGGPRRADRRKHIVGQGCDIANVVGSGVRIQNKSASTTIDVDDDARHAHEVAHVVEALPVTESAASRERNVGSQNRAKADPMDALGRIASVNVKTEALTTVQRSSNVPFFLLACAFMVSSFVLTSCVTMDADSQYDMEQSSEKEDGHTAGVVGLSPGESFSLRAQCEEWFSCDLDVNIFLDSIGLNAVYAEAETRADLAEVAGNFVYRIPLFRVRITEVAPNVSFEIDVAAEVSGSRVSGSAIASTFSFIAGGQRMSSELLTFFAESDDEDAAYDIELESIQDFDRVVQVRVSAQWW